MSDEVLTKVCTKCGEEKPLDAFNMGKRGKPRAECKSCASIAAKIRNSDPVRRAATSARAATYLENPEVKSRNAKRQKARLEYLSERARNDVSSRTCPQCGQTKPASEFPVGNPRCKQCKAQNLVASGAYRRGLDQAIKMGKDRRHADHVIAMTEIQGLITGDAVAEPRDVALEMAARISASGRSKTYVARQAGVSHKTLLKALSCQPVHHKTLLRIAYAVASLPRRTGSEKKVATAQDGASCIKVDARDTGRRRLPWARPSGETISGANTPNDPQAA